MKLSEIQIVIHSGGSGPNPLLFKWLQGLPIDTRMGSFDHPRDVARNHNVTRFIKEDIPRGKNFLVMVNADTVPVMETNEIISREGDFIYCGDRADSGAPGHYGDGDFGPACCRLSANMLLEMQAPLFKLPINENRTVRSGCECVAFRKQAQALGYEPKMVGIVGNLCQCIIFPKPESKTGFSLVWPNQLQS
jgi:hypothetical protein